MKQKKRSLTVVCLLWTLILALAGGMAAPALAEEKEGKVVRVGLYKKNGYHMVDMFGRHSGYDYEYLKKIASYTGWEYEYVEGTWDECVSMLKSGEIDLLGSVQKSVKRQKEMRFASRATMCSANCLLELKDSDRFTYEDIEAFDGMRIGFLKGAEIEYALRQYSQEKGFDYVAKQYDSEISIRRALREGEIDAACLGSHRDLAAYKVLAYFGYSNRYYVTSQNRQDLQKELDDALQEIWVKEPMFEANLHEKYYENNHSVAFTKEEQAYIENSGSVPVALYMEVGKLLCRYDEKQKKHVGLMLDVMNVLSKRTGLKFKYKEIPEHQVASEYLAEHPDEVIAPALLNSLISQETGYRCLEPVVKGQMLTVTRMDHPLKLEDPFTLAVPAGLYSEADQLEAMFPKAALIPVTTHRSGLELVASGKADMALVNEITAAYQMQSPFFDKLQVVELTDITEDLTLAVSPAMNPLLVSILNKAIFSLNVRDVRQMVVDNTASTSYEMTAGEWLYARRFLVVNGTIVSIGMLLYFILRSRFKWQKAKDREKILLTEERLKAEKDFHEQLFHQANFDELTGIYNKTYFMRRANELLRQHPDRVYTFIRINLKSFKMLNDLYGREAGDAVLKNIANSMREHVGAWGGLYGRLYADQFVACVEVEKEMLETQLRKANVRLQSYKGQKIPFKLHVGAYRDEKHCQDAVQALDYAQIALAKNKESMEVVSYFQESYLESMRLKQHITDEMEQALAEGQFKVYLQPQFDVAGKYMIGAEALVRWIHPERGMISPAEFIPVFEQNRFIYKLDSYMCDQVCGLLKKWLDQGKAVPVSVNLSQIDMESPDLIDMLEETLERHKLPIQYLHLEITESAYAEDRNRARHVIDRLRELGFYIEMDDFGCGYSSLNMLKDVQVDVLKMDMQFLDEETHMDRGGNIIRSVVQMAHSMGILVVAEGVETEREANFLKSIGCNFVQGYLYSRPVPIGEFESLIQTSEIGEKRIRLEVDKATDKLYWKMEMYEILLQSEGAILFNYDPDLDQAVFSTMEEGVQQKEIVQNRYAERLSENLQIHPDHREAVRAAFYSGDSDRAEIDFLGDFHGNGTYEWFRAKVYYYRRNNVHRRTLAVIKRRSEQ